MGHRGRKSGPPDKVSELNLHIVYLMGAGRSGTTVLATLLGSERGIYAPGELNQLPEHVLGAKDCGCGSSLGECPHWAPFLTRLTVPMTPEFCAIAQDVEGHGSVWRFFASGTHPSADRYRSGSLAILKLLSDEGARPVVDSSKYVGRALALARVEGLRVSVLYVVRDPRGVVDSFQKPVQTTRSPWSAVFYYLAVNTVAELACRTLLRGRARKVRYEDLIERPSETLTEVGAFLGYPLDQAIQLAEAGAPIPMGHLIGGNRIRSHQEVRLERRLSELTRVGRMNRILIWLATLPLNILNRYRP